MIGFYGPRNQLAIHEPTEFSENKDKAVDLAVDGWRWRFKQEVSAESLQSTLSSL